MSKLFPTYEVGSLPKLNARVRAVRGQPVTDEDIKEVRSLAKRFSVEESEVVEILERQRQKKGKLTSEEETALADFNALLYLRLQEGMGFDVVYDGEARRAEMYQHVATRVSGFEKSPEMIRSRGPDSWRMAVCVDTPVLQEGSLADLVIREFEFVRKHAVRPIKIPIDDPYMIAVMSDNRYYLESLRPEYGDDPRQLRYEAKRAFTLALARRVIRPQVEAVVERRAAWIQLDIPAATLDIKHIPILVEGVNAVVEGIKDVKLSLHLCYPRRVSLTEEKGYELLFPALLNLNPQVNHLSLELANADQYEDDLAIFAQYRDQRQFELGVGVMDITLEQQQRKRMETPEIVKNRILRAATTLGDDRLVYVAPDCGLRQLQLDRCLKLYETMIEGAELARRG
ncbi:hypothetical protein HYX14_00055 [Candidatus Woesearchaeota archaeon]|nr:hypothetical protein [Candidatus Woesearchaeota archaeon]